VLTVLVCGGRFFGDRAWLGSVLGEIHRVTPITKIVEGGALGADRLARQWAVARGIAVSTFEADWKVHGRAAGPMRNARMLDLAKPDMVVAFPGGSGTANMVRQAVERQAIDRRLSVAVVQKPA
jgi:hypothetical protein